MTYISTNDVRAVEGVMPALAHAFNRVHSFTMTSEARVSALLRLVSYVLTGGVPGAIVECGVWRGGSMMAAALALLDAGVDSRELYLYDTFNGMPPPSDADIDCDGMRAADLLAGPGGHRYRAVASIGEVRRNLVSTGYPRHRIHCVAGLVEETLPAQAPDGAIALLRIDTDWYASTRHALRHLYPLLSPGGVLILDDYGHWQGARQAVDEYFGVHQERLVEIDYTGRFLLKSDRLAVHAEPVEVLPTRSDLLRLVAPGGRVAEVGVFAGDFSAEMLDACAPSELHLIDTWDGRIECGDKDGREVVTADGQTLYCGVRQRFAHRPEVVVRRGLSVEMLGRCRDGYFNFVYVDASHDYTSVAADLAAAARVVVPGGAIGGHDYCKAFPGVVRAVDEFCCSSGWRLAHLTRDGCPSYRLERVA